MLRRIFNPPSMSVFKNKSRILPNKKNAHFVSVFNIFCVILHIEVFNLRIYKCCKNVVPGIVNAFLVGVFRHLVFTASEFLTFRYAYAQ